MLKNLFNKKEVTPKKATNYPAIVDEIHNEFNTAGEKLLIEARKIIDAQPVVNKSKNELLKSFGFKNTQEVQRADTVLGTIKISEEQMQLINKYAIKYPLQKFITETQVESICKKYNLIFGYVEQYTGFVPEKNLKQIANFKLRKEDKNTIIATARKYSSTEQFEIILENAELREDRTYWHIYLKGSDARANYAFQSEDGIEFYSNDKHNIFGLRSFGNLRFNINTGLKICAPVKDMDVTGYTVSKGYKLLKNIPDPVVLQPIKGGYLILTAWGDEASDPLVVNQNSN